MDLFTFLYFAAGLAALITGAEFLVRGASKLASLLGISPLIIGLTVVSFGTSSPELAVSLQSAFDGKADISIGNVVGSNIFNVLFILGISASITPLVVSRQLIRTDVPIMIFVSFLLLLLGYDGSLSRFDGLILVVGIILYLAFLVSINRKDNQLKKREVEKDAGVEKKKSILILYPMMVIFGLILLVLGSRWLVSSAVEIAEYLGLSQLLVGLTIVAAGTSLPEVATSVVAAFKGERDIAVGNVVGSNIFNILVILGITAIAVPGGVFVSESAVQFDIPVMIIVAIACLPVFFTGNLISRWEGILFVSYYIFYITYLFLVVSANPNISLFISAMIYFVMPLTVITLLVLSYRYYKR